MKVITVSNIKGGVGKSTSTQCIATILNQLGHKTLVIDLDKQRNTSFAYQANIEDDEFTILDVLQSNVSHRKGGLQLKDAITKTANGDIVLSSKYLTPDANNWIERSEERTEILKVLLQNLSKSDDYEFVLIDTNMNDDLLLESAYIAADEIIIPTDDDEASVTGVVKVTALCSELNSYGSKIKIGGILLVRYTNRTNIWKKQEERYNDLAKAFGTKVFSSKIPNATAVKDAHHQDTNIAAISKKSKVTIAYADLVNELLEEK